MSQYVTTPDGQRHIFPDSATPEQMKTALSSYLPQAAHSTAQPTSHGASWSWDPMTRALDFLPTAGGFAGGLAGGAIGAGAGGVGAFPGAIAGAGIGGAIGEAGREVGLGRPLSAPKIGLGGAEQAAWETGGGFLAKGAGRLAKPLMRRAMGVGKTIMSNFPDVVETALSKRIPVSQGGAAKAKALREASSMALNNILSQAKSGGKGFNTADVASRVDDLLKSDVLPDSEKARILTQLTEFAKQRGATIDPVLLKKIKQFYQHRAQTIFRAEKTGAPTIAQQNRALFSQAIARGSKQQLETIPGVAAREAETKSLIGTQRALENAITRPPKPFEIHKPGSYPIANNPYVVSRLALTLESPQFQSILRQSPRTAAALIVQLTHAAQPDQIGVGQ